MQCVLLTFAVITINLLKVKNMEISMSAGYIIFLILFIIVISVFAFLDTRQGFRPALPLFLRIFMPMLLTGVIVKIPELIGVTQKGDVASYIIGGIGTIIFYSVLINVFKKEEGSRKLNILDYFVGFLLGIGRGWLYFGFFTLFLNRIFGFSFVKPELLRAIEEPVKWVLFLGFF
jgi:uncharacterized membrane protein required for colicin V production